MKGNEKGEYGFKNKRRLHLFINLFAIKICGPTWTRTRDHLIMSQVL